MVYVLQAFLPLLQKAAVANSDKKFGINRAAIIYVSSFLGCLSLNEGEKGGNFWGYRESKVI